jgi:hypothetical protein
VALACNINRRGRGLRIVSGAIFVVGAIVFPLAEWPPAWWGWVIAAVLLLIGIFHIVEGAIGWCAMRAMGFRTPV